MTQGFKLGGRALMTYVAALFLALLLLIGIGEDWYWAQVALNVLLFGGMLLLMYMDGGAQGERASTMSATAQRMREQGQTPPPDLLKKCFTKRAALVCYLTFMLPLALVATANLIAEPFYPPVIVQDIPVPEYDADAALTMDGSELPPVLSSDDGESAAVNPFSVAARAVFMPVLAAYRPFNENPHGLNWLFLIVALITPLPAALGYLNGPALRKKKLAAIEKGKRRKMRGLKVNKQPRAPRPPKHEV